MKWDLFISYASESRDRAIIPFASVLYENGFLWAWFDQRNIEDGHSLDHDSLAHKLSEGMENSWMGAVFLTPRYLEKYWTMKELNVLITQDKPMFLHGLDITEDECERWIPNIKDLDFVDVTGMHPHSYATAILKLVSRVRELNFVRHRNVVARQYFVYDCLHLFINRALGQSDRCSSSTEILERNHAWRSELSELSSAVPRFLDIDENWVHDKRQYIGHARTILSIGDGPKSGIKSPDDTSAVAEGVLAYAREKLFLRWLDNADLVLDLCGVDGGSNLTGV
ncbi:MAG: hypothetical protein DHS20C16_36280 [Phycisphaerae bacterium]|nr:MAG: hypothetical protein DHS20C16_36280 [Phycisphaerae bacterium]